MKGTPFPVYERQISDPPTGCLIVDAQEYAVVGSGMPFSDAKVPLVTSCITVAISSPKLNRMGIIHLARVNSNSADESDLRSSIRQIKSELGVNEANGVVIVSDIGLERKDLPNLLSIASEEGVHLKVFNKNIGVESFVVRGVENEIDEINTPLDEITLAYLDARKGRLGDNLLKRVISNDIIREEAEYLQELRNEVLRRS